MAFTPLNALSAFLAVARRRSFAAAARDLGVSTSTVSQVAIRKVVQDSFTELGRIDVVISNAGYGLFGAAEELSDPPIEQVLATNLVGPIHLIRAVLPGMRAQGGGTSHPDLVIRRPGRVPR